MAIGVVASASPVDVLPWFLARSFERLDTFAVRGNVYANGEGQFVAEVEAPRAVFRFAHDRLTPGQIDELLQFYRDHNGPHGAFYFYDVNETVDFA